MISILVSKKMLRHFVQRAQFHTSNAHCFTQWQRPSVRVFVATDRIHFVDKQVMSTHTNVKFNLYGKVKHMQGYPNVAQIESSKAMTDVMICVDVAQTTRDNPCIVVSKNKKMLKCLPSLLSNVFHVSSKSQLSKHLNEMK